MQRIYRRNGQAVAVEAIPAQRGENRLRVRWPDGRELFETFASERLMLRRLETLDSELAALDWDRELERDATASFETDLRRVEPAERRSGLGDRRRVTRRDRRIKFR